MNISEIQGRLSALVVAMMDKGLAQPNADLTLKANAAPYIYMTAKDLHSKHMFHYGNTAEQCFEKANALVASMPEPAIAKLHNHMKRVADCIDKGREDGIDDAYITPLVVVKAAMTENLLMKGDAK